MMKIILLVVALVATTFAKSQDDIYLTARETEDSYTPSSTEYVSGTTELLKTIDVNKNRRYFYLVEVNADSLNSDSSVVISLQGGSTADKLYDLESVTWSMTTSDTSVYFEEMSNPIGWPVLGVSFKGNSSATRAELPGGEEAIHINILPESD